MDLWLWGFLLLLALYGIVRLTWDLSTWHRRSRGRRTRPGAVSLLILARDAEESIEGLVRVGYGLLRQTLGQGEIIVIDEKSSDGTWEILRKLQRHFPLLKAARWQGEAGDPATGRPQSALEMGYFLSEQPLVLVVRAGQRRGMKMPVTTLRQGLGLARQLDLDHPQEEENDR